MAEKKEKKGIPRREFLKAAGITAGAVGAATAVASSGTARAAVASEAGSASTGYRETEHVRKYYELARF